MHEHIEPLPKPSEKSAQPYIAGFALSIALTIGAFMLVWAYQASDGQMYSRSLLLGLLAVLAIAQLLVQARFFLHVSRERKQRLNLVAALFTAMVVLTIVVGSIWIMQNLNYTMMSHDTSSEIQQDEGITH
ncbi:cytochrome o ubiquinol oxidase subunit IV [Candidatus Saccharibacteria bacterium]|nr:cytochrome o ubiquinol oxidase subunit IV [Candidatus Saccharibacteria bacterium]